MARPPPSRPLGSLRVRPWAGGRGAGRGSGAPIGYKKVNIRMGRGGAGSGSGRRRLKRFWRFRTWSRCLQVPWAGLRLVEGTRDAEGTWGWAMAGARGAAAAASAGSATSSGTPPPQEPGLGELLEEFSRTQYRAKDCSGTAGSRVSS